MNTHIITSHTIPTTSHFDLALLPSSTIIGIQPIESGFSIEHRLLIDQPVSEEEVYTRYFISIAVGVEFIVPDGTVLIPVGCYVQRRTIYVLYEAVELKPTEITVEEADGLKIEDVIEMAVEEETPAPTPVTSVKPKRGRPRKVRE